MTAQPSRPSQLPGEDIPDPIGVDDDAVVVSAVVVPSPRAVVAGTGPNRLSAGSAGQLPSPQLSAIVAQTEGTASMTKLWLIGAVGLMLATTGCGGGGAEVESTVSGATLGQELQDLEKARADGLISEDEYEDSREAIMERYE